MAFQIPLFMNSGHAVLLLVTQAFEPRVGLLPAAGLVLVFGWLLQCSLGLYPRIFANGWCYSEMARLVPLDQVVVPSCLFPRSTGPGMLGQRPEERSGESASPRSRSVPTNIQESTFACPS